MNTRLGIAEVEVTTVRKLDHHERQALEAKVAAMAKERDQRKISRRPVAGGRRIVKIGSTVYDDSVRGRLNRLKEQLAAS